MLTRLRCCRLRFDNLDALVMICKNSSDDAHIDCPLTFIEKNETNYLYSKVALLDDHKKELQKQRYFEDE